MSRILFEEVEQKLLAKDEMIKVAIIKYLNIQTPKIIAVITLKFRGL